MVLNSNSMRVSVCPQEAWLLTRERELKEELRRERDKEIELAIWTLEEETSKDKEECERAAENRCVCVCVLNLDSVTLLDIKYDTNKYSNQSCCCPVKIHYSFCCWWQIYLCVFYHRCFII